MLRFLHPKWVALHLFVWGSAVAMVLLGRWQWDVGHASRGDLRNYAYAGQWLIFAAFAIFLWVRVLRDAPRPPEDRSEDDGNEALAGAGAAIGRSTGPTYRGYVMPQSDAIVVDDSEVAAYNAYLSALADSADSLASARPANSGAAEPSPAGSLPAVTPLPAAPVPAAAVPAAPVPAAPVPAAAVPAAPVPPAAVPAAPLPLAPAARAKARHR